ncbi:16S rRNA (uracil1498-N3)-methyltransferase [Mobilisporobacter senegalensis]|uniref:Ribosomal RNA small subunit methyltransferase E n=1 Tax=Mobilisporobacter senegalensis TaxID=1329262 RepID=A0A3N1XVJ3_9FIRM|nr:16S rRNA (uracil(1498)-N(3))-methyltransferase [Mobilisporobacter senegalensis]ROR30616.1 16S rRNA (uracil1498-N3)-methyltransferase [Mobilisporobacter senegalensis]
MHRFYVENDQIHGKEIVITGQDVNHIRNVLRMKIDDEIIICNGQGKDFYCIINQISSNEVIADIMSEQDTDAELQTKIYLFQGLPKKDKMELIIQKAVELGVYEIIPVVTKRSIVKLDEKKKELKKLERWQSISTSAAKQSGRGIIPRVSEVMTYKEAIDFASKLEYNVIPYEKAEDIDKTRDIVKSAKGKQSLGIFIGPEGGFEESEIDMAFNRDIKPVTLGRRILRTETAGLAILSIIMFELER